MARSRNIKPGLYKNEDLAECSIWARYIFPALWMQAGREGILEDRPKRLKGEILPYDTVDIEPLLAELHDRAFIYRYVDAEGRRLIFITTFSTHQSPHYSEKSSGMKPPTLPEKWRQAAARSLGEAPEQPERSPDNSRSQPAIKRGSQPPDSLIPDSTTPPSPPAARGGVDKPEPQPPASPTKRPSGQWWKSPEGLSAMGKFLAMQGKVGESPAAYGERLRNELDRRKAEKAPTRKARDVPTRDQAIAEHPTRGSLVDSSDPAPPAIPEPIARARDPEPDPEPMPEQADEPGDLPDAGQELELGEWWKDANSVMARGVELRMPIWEGEGFEDYTARVLAQMGHEAPLDRIDDDELRERVTYFARIGPLSDAARPTAG